MTKPLKIALVAHNARFTHTNPSVRSMLVNANKQLSAAIDDGRLTFVACELTINDPLDDRAAKLHDLDADIYLFSAYIWNIEETKAVAEIIKKANPNRLIGCGGPEVSYTPETDLIETPWFDFILCGEGEVQIVELGKAILKHWIPLLSSSKIQISSFFAAALASMTTAVRGMVCRDRYAEIRVDQSSALNLERPEIKFVYGPANEYVDLNQLPFLWDQSLGEEINSDEQIKNRMLYYESSRGCPFHCVYCLSSVEKGLRLRDLNKVFIELKELVDRDAMLVKFVDRSFNAVPSRAQAIWQYLIDIYRPGQKTRFHFEIEADLMDQAALDLLTTAPSHLFQFEIGVQTTNNKVLKTIKRQQNNDHVASVVSALRRTCDIHLHLDLIAGLPGEDMNSFKQSFNDVYAMKPDVIQLGFLKILKGTPMAQMATERGYTWRTTPPYEVITSDGMSYADLQSLKRIEAVLDRFYNQPWLDNVLEPVLAAYSDAFSFYEDLAAFGQKRDLLYRRVSAEEWYAELLRFAKEWVFKDNENPQKAQAWHTYFKSCYQAQQRRGRINWDVFVSRYGIEE